MVLTTIRVFLIFLVALFTMGQTLSDKEWDKLCIEEGLHLKHDYQLVEMLESHTAKLSGAIESCYYLTKYPDTIRIACEKEGYNSIDTEKKVVDEIASCNADKKKLEEVVERITKEQDLRKRGVVDRKPID